jgi:hypothetical protein
MHAYDVTVQSHDGQTLNVLILSKTEIPDTESMENAVHNWMSCEFDFLGEGPEFTIMGMKSLGERHLYLGEIGGINVSYSELGTPIKR